VERVSRRMKKTEDSDIDRVGLKRVRNRIAWIEDPDASLRLLIFQMVLRMIEILNKEIQMELKAMEEQLVEPKQKSLLELIRCADERFCFVSYVLPRTHEDYANQLFFFKLMTLGLYDCIKTCFGVADGNIDLSYESTEYTINWANNILLKGGKVALTQRYIGLTKSNLYSLHREGGNVLIFSGILANPFKEFFDSGQSNWLMEQKIVYNLYHERIRALSPLILKELKKNSKAVLYRQDGYNKMPIIDEYYFLLGQGIAKGMVGYDSIPENAALGEFTYSDFQEVLTGIIGISLKHLNLCYTYFNKIKYKGVNLRNFCTLQYKIRVCKMNCVRI
jgi:hypothetical protein